MDQAKTASPTDENNTNNNNNNKQQGCSSVTTTSTASKNLDNKETPVVALLQETSSGVEPKSPLSALTSSTTNHLQQKRQVGVEMRLKSPATALSSVQVQHHHHPSITPATGGGVGSPTTKTAPTTTLTEKTEDDYIKSDKLHTYHGRTTHYYRDEPKHHEMLLSVKVNKKKQTANSKKKEFSRV